MIHLYLRLPNIINPYEVPILFRLVAIIPVRWILNPSVISFADTTSLMALKNMRNAIGAFAFVMPPLKQDSYGSENHVL
jgi:hypothetical protein